MISPDGRHRAQQAHREAWFIVAATHRYCHPMIAIPRLEGLFCNMIFRKVGNFNELLDRAAYFSSGGAETLAKGMVTATNPRRRFAA
jgi:hypothetical protein